MLYNIKKIIYPDYSRPTPDPLPTLDRVGQVSIGQIWWLSDHPFRSYDLLSVYYGFQWATKNFLFR